MSKLFGHVVVVGGGLIGSSFLRACRLYDAAENLSLIDADADVLARAEKLGLADSYSDDLRHVDGADLVMLAVPVGAMAAVAEAMADHVKVGAIVSDVGSVKASVVRDLQAHLPGYVHVIPAHPVAGTEQSGPEAGFASLFKDRWCILTPTNGSSAPAVEKLSALWTQLGSRVEIMTADHHDRVLAITSHVPHLIAFNIVGTASDLESVTKSEVISYSAGGFRDFTRIAASDPVMWRDVFLANKEAVLEMLGRFSEDLSALARAIRWEDGAALETLFARTRDIRLGIVDAGQDTAGADFGRGHDSD